MHRYLLFFAFLGITFISSARKTEILLIEEVVLDSSAVDPSLNENEALYRFTFKGMYDNSSVRKIHYSIDGKTLVEKLTDRSILLVKATPGKHLFQFYYSSSYYEVYTDSLPIEARHKADWTVNLRFSQMDEVAEKPIIYLYPKVPTEVSMTLNIQGDRPFLYPAYNDGWQFTAQPNGDLTFGETTYNYLFWEASNVAPFRTEDSRTGFVVSGNQSTRFLEEKLTEAGLSSKEQADFITYWAPRMMKNDQNLVHFLFNEDCERYATLNISPKPDHIYRIYMVWTAIEADYLVESQKIETIDRSGFTVLEWGGQESAFKREVSQVVKLDK